MMEKKKWRRPELVVLVRSTPEEAILVICKNDQSLGSPGEFIANCTDMGPGCTLCLETIVT